MAAPAAVLAASAGAGFFAAEVTPTVTGDSSTSIIVGGVVAIVVALIGGAVQFYVTRRGRNDEPELTLGARVMVLESNQADMKRTIDLIEEHVRPWPKGGRPR